MENRSFVLFLILVFLWLLMWNAWQRDYHSPAPGSPDTNAVEGNNEQDASSPELPQGQFPAQPQGQADPQARQSLSSVPAPQVTTSANSIVARTDVLELRISPVGGTIERISLLNYPVEMDIPEEVVVLGDEGFLVQSGVGGNEVRISHNHDFVAHSDEYILSENEDELVVRLRWQEAEASGLEVEKVYTLNRDSYQVQLDHNIINNSGSAIAIQSYAQMQRRSVPQRSFLDPSYTGVVFSGPADPYLKLDLEDLRESNMAQTVKDGWIAWLQHYFLAAVLPAQSCNCSYYTLYVNDGSYVVGAWGGAKTIEQGGQAKLSHKLYLGPKEQHRLERAAKNLELTVDFGWLFFISDILFTVLVWLYAIVGNWGVAIILLTVLIKLLFFPLTAISFRSMAHLRELQPRIEALKKRHGDDRVAMQQALMRIYKEEKINPLGGCLPILVQIPVFIALYWVLFESVELRQADFALWIRDLSSPDPYFVLPLLMGISMYVQQKLSPQSPDPVQRKIISFMPIPFTLFTLLFPSGLVLYWVVSNTLSIVQQWFITRRFSKNNNKV